MEVINDLKEFNGLIKDVNFHAISSIGDRGRVCCVINNFHIHVFKRHSGFGIEMRPGTVEGKRALRSRIESFNSVKLFRKDGVFYPWPKQLTDDKMENTKRLKILIEIAISSDYNELSDDSKKLLKG
jgi:hypothetical protein